MNTDGIALIEQGIKTGAAPADIVDAFNEWTALREQLKRFGEAERYYLKAIVNELRANMVRAKGNFGNDPIKAKIANAEQAKVHTELVSGPRDMEAGAVSVRLHHGGPQGVKPRAEEVVGILDAIRNRAS